MKENDENGQISEYTEILRRLALNRRNTERYVRNNKLAFYNSGETVHVKQVEFHKCLKRNRWVFGGNRTGKTECGAAETAWLLRGNHPYRKVSGAVTEIGRAHV